MLSDIELLDASEENLRWFQENSREIQQKFEKEVIAIKDKKIVAHATNSKKLLGLLKDKKIDPSEVLIEPISSKEEIIIL